LCEVRDNFKGNTLSCASNNTSRICSFRRPLKRHRWAAKCRCLRHTGPFKLLHTYMLWVSMWLHGKLWVSSAILLFGNGTACRTCRKGTTKRHQIE